MQEEFSRVVSEKYSNHKLHENPSCSMLTDRQTEGYTHRRTIQQTEMTNTRFQTFAVI